MRFRLLAFALVTFGYFHQVAFAALQAYEGFEFDGPAIAGQGSGFGWNAGWINSAGNFQFVTSDDVSLDSTAFPFTPVGNRVQAPSTPRAAEAPAARDLVNPFPLNQDGQLFMSVLIQKEDSQATAGNNLEISFQSGTAHRSRFGSTTDNKFFLTTSSSATAGQVSEEVHNFGETYFVVMKVLASATANHQVFAKLYAAGSEPPTVEPTEWDLAATAAAAVTASIDRVRMSAGLNAWGAIDEIRVGTTWADVTSPATTLPGDFNFDGTVDAADYVVWRKNAGLSTEYDEWKAHFGEMGGVEEGTGSIAGGRATVPEPSALALIVLGCVVLAAKNSRIR